MLLSRCKGCNEKFVAPIERSGHDQKACMVKHLTEWLLVPADQANFADYETAAARRNQSTGVVFTDE